MSTLHADARAASAQLLRDYAAASGVRLQVYEGRPRHIAAPSAFVDRMTESVEYVGITLRQRRPTVEVVVLHGLFDLKDTADQKDRFVDGFLDYVTGLYHAAGANTLIALTSIEDDPSYVAEWVTGDEQGPYYATRLSLEVYAED